MAPPLETERLIFRDWIDADLAPFHRICSDPRVMEFVGDGRPWSLERTEQFIQRATEISRTFGFCQWPLILKADVALVGYCGFVPAGDDVEIGWRLGRKYWGRGLATEAARAALDHGFQKLGFQHVIATVQSANQASLRVIEKLGMERESSFSRDERTVLAYSMRLRRRVQSGADSP